MVSPVLLINELGKKKKGFKSSGWEESMYHQKLTVTMKILSRSKSHRGTSTLTSFINKT